jgi:hypothetical protein
LQASRSPAKRVLAGPTPAHRSNSKGARTMRRIIAKGSAKDLLPAYDVPLDVLGGLDIIRSTDLIKIGKDELDYHAWTAIEDGSTLIGLKVIQACITCRSNVTVARRVS